MRLGGQDGGGNVSALVGYKGVQRSPRSLPVFKGPTSKDLEDGREMGRVREGNGRGTLPTIHFASPSEGEAK